MRSRRGDTLYILFSVLVVLFIMGLSLSWVYQQQVTQVGHIGGRLQVHYLALAGIDRATTAVRSALDSPLVKTQKVNEKDEMEIDQNVLNLLDPERAKEWARSFEFKDGEIVAGGTCRVVAEILDVTKNEFFTYIDRVEKIPPGLEAYREKRDEEDNPVLGALPLGGWSGRLKITATATYQGARTVVEAVKDVKVIDITPPAPDHTLFIHGKKTEYLKDGFFVLSNLTLPDQVADLIHGLTIRMNDVLSLPDISRDKKAWLTNVEAITKRLVVADAEGDNPEALKLLAELTEHVAKSGGDEKIKDMVDNIILSLNPRDWGRVRTNGVLQVYLPFFAPDDIINYFADASIFGQQRPEVGYQNNYNRLHDPYLSVYTHYEGYIYKNFRRLNPPVMGKPEPPMVVAPQRYTINTRMNYVLRYPEREPVPNLERLEKNALKHATRVFKSGTFLSGTKEAPIELDGIWFARETVRISGFYKGNGMIVCEKDIVITDHLKRADENAPNWISLVAIGGDVKLGRTIGRTVAECGIYAKDGLKGTRSAGLTLLGNLAVEELDRPHMPKWFEVRFNPQLKNHTADNLMGAVSHRFISFKVLGDTSEAKDKKL